MAIILFVSVFRLVRNTRYQNRKEEDAGQKTDTGTTQSYYQKKENAIITCDYCGSKVDTGKHAVCDHCGGPYWDDEEWKNIRNNKEA